MNCELNSFVLNGVLSQIWDWNIDLFHKNIDWNIDQVSLKKIISKKLISKSELVI